MTVSAWWLLLAAVPVLLLGEFIVRHVRVLARFNIPVPVVGGLLVALLILVTNLSGLGSLTLETHVAARWWTWPVLAEPEWLKSGPKRLDMPLMVFFFTTVGLNASWSVARRGGWQLLLFLGLAGLLAILQNGVGLALSRIMGISPYLGLMCGSASMTGGHGTAMGFAPEFERLGLAGAGVVGVAAATFGLVSGGLLGGPIAANLMGRFRLKPPADERAAESPAARQAEEAGFIAELRALGRLGRPLLVHLLILLLCVKAGAYVSLGLRTVGATFPVYIGAMVVGIIVRNVLDAAGKRTIDTGTVEMIGSVFLGLFLAIAMMSLNLVELTRVAGPMAVILAAQVTVMALFAYCVTFNVMGRDFGAAVMSAGHCGFGLGATPAAVANMEAVTASHGPSPRAFLVVTIVGAFLIDFVNVMNITLYLNFAGRLVPGAQ